MSLLLAAIAAYLPVLAWLWFFYHRDRYEREPRRLIAILFGLGAVAGLAAGFANDIGGALLGIPLILLAGFTEEPIKFGLMAWRTRRSPELDEPVDGLIYGTTVGLGFAAFETTFYILRAWRGDPSLVVPGVDPTTLAFLWVAPLRAVSSALMHAFASGIAGYFFAVLVLRRAPLWPRIVGPLLGVAIAHSAFNGLLPISVISILPLLAFAYWLLLRRALAVSPHRRDELAVAAPPVPTSVVAAVAPLRRLCPRCGEDIAAVARQCRYCRHKLTPPEAAAGPTG